MAVYPIKTFDGDGGGLDFAEFWNDVQLVSATVTKFSAALESAVCYCMRLNVVENSRNSTFYPYGGTGLASQPIDSLPTIRFYRLLTDDEIWPVLGRWAPDATDGQHPSAIANGKWHGEVRLKSGQEYVGFLKAVLLETAVDDDRFELAYREVKRWLTRKVALLQRTGIWRSPAAIASLQTTLELVGTELETGPRRTALKRGIHRLAALITSHLGTGFNRVACLMPIEGALECLHAHGGDCSANWASRVQSELVEQATSPDDLQARVGLHIPPVDDPLFRELTNPPLRVRQDSTCIIQAIWESKGNLNAIPRQNQVLDEPEFDFQENGILVHSDPYPIAARFSLREPWVASCLPADRHPALFASKNGEVFLLPWSINERTVGLWLFDLGQWSSFDEGCDVVPRLKSAKGLLDRFSLAFERFV